LTIKQKEDLVDFFAAQSLDILPDISSNIHIVKSQTIKSRYYSSPSRLQTTISRNKSKRKISSPAPVKISPRQGLHRAVSTGIVTYKGGLTPAKFPFRSPNPKSFTRGSIQSLNIKTIGTSPVPIIENSSNLEAKTTSVQKSPSIFKEGELYPTLMSFFEIPRGSRAKRLSKSIFR